MDAERLTLTPWVSGLGFGEAPRWHDGALWLSDITEQRVLRVDTTGQVQTVVSTPGEPSGLGWLPDGGLLVVQMAEHEVWRYANGTLQRYCATAPISRSKLNDMVVDRNGRAWASNFGFDYETEMAYQTGEVSGRNLSAFAGHWGVGYNWLKSSWKPRIQMTLPETRALP